MLHTSPALLPSSPARPIVTRAEDNQPEKSSYGAMAKL
jgi:hypothetical protein